MIRLEAIQRDFPMGEQTVHALQDISLQIGHGEYLSIMGPSGSGKSTLLHIIGLLDQPTSGQYFFNEKDVTVLSEVEQAQIRSRQIGFVFQFFHLIPRLTAAENIELPMVLAGYTVKQRRERVAHALGSIGLADRASHHPDQLSGGQRQRVAIARATIMQPQIILADEPTGNLDRHSGEAIVHVLEELNQQGIALVVVTHDPEIGQRAQRKLKMSDGRIVSDQTAEAGKHATV